MNNLHFNESEFDKLDKHQFSVPQDSDKESILRWRLGFEREMTEEESWRMDEAWTFQVSYMAEMYVPGEG